MTHKFVAEDYNAGYVAAGVDADEYGVATAKLVVDVLVPGHFANGYRDRVQELSK